MRFRIVLTMVTGALLLCSPGSAQGRDDWRRMQTDNFYLVGDASEGAMRRVAQRLEEFRAAFLAVRPSAAAAISDTDTTVVVFDSDRDFRPYKPLRPDGEPGNVAGVFLGSNYGDYIALTGERDAERTIYHEYVHRVSKEDRSWPPWLREGIAEFYSTIQVRDGGDTVRVGSVIGEKIRFFQNTALIPLDRFLEMGPERYGGPDQHRFYAQSWALTHYLLLKRPGGQGQLQHFLDLSASGGDTSTNFQTAFQTDLEGLFQELDLYVSNSLTMPIIDYSLETRLKDAGRWDAEDISEAEANYHLGELLFRERRFDDARVYLEEAIAQAPEMVQPFTRMGILYEMEGDTDAAFEYFERAAGMEGAGYLPHLLYAKRALFRNGYSDPGAVESATEHLRRAVALRPESVESLQRLGEVLLSVPARADEALEVLGRAVQLDRRDPNLFLTYLRALWLSGQTESARATTAIFAQTTPDPEVRRKAEALLEDIERFGDPNRFATVGAATARIDTRPDLTRNETVPDRDGGATEVTLSGDTSVLPPGMEKATGRLTAIDCSGDGVRLWVEIEGQSVRFAASDPEGISFISFSAQTSNSIACGETSPPKLVRVTYDPELGSEFANSDSLGNPLVVEFLPE